MQTRSLSALCSLIVVGSAAQAAIINNNGASDVLVAGPGVGYTSDFFDDTTVVVHGWNERQAVMLTTGVNVDITTTGFFNMTGLLTPGTIAAGTLVNSHTLYFDPLTNQTAVAGFQFDGTIIGVIVDEALKPTDYFMDSDFLIPASVPLANIPTAHFNARGMEISENGDTIQVNAQSVIVNLGAGSPGDQIRVLTTVVPEPCSALVGLGAFAAALRMRWWNRGH